MRYLVIKDNIVRNVVEWDGVSAWTPPPDCLVVPAPDGVGPGWLWNDGDPTNPDPPTSQPPIYMDQSDVDTMDKALKVAVLVAAQWTSHTPAQAKALFKTIWDMLP